MKHIKDIIYEGASKFLVNKKSSEGSLKDAKYSIEFFWGAKGRYLCYDFSVDGNEVTVDIECPEDFADDLISNIRSCGMYVHDASKNDDRIVTCYALKDAEHIFGAGKQHTFGLNFVSVIDDRK